MKKFLRVLAVAMLLLAIAIPCMAAECTVAKDGKHVWVETGRKDATCTEDGMIWYECSACKAAWDTTTLPATGHDFGEGAKVKQIYNESTCTVQGDADVYCKNKGCNEVKWVHLPLAAHKSAKCTNTYYVTEPTCGKDGAIGATYCTVCSKTLTTTTVPATGKHEMHREKYDAKDCTEKSYTQLECKLCGYVDKSSKEVGKAGAHTWSDLDYTLVSEATCTKAEMRAPYCTVCGVTGTAVAHEDKPALGHDWDKAVITKKATCDKEGEKSWTCKRCGEVYKEKIAKLNHSETVVTIVKPTCTKAGSNTTTCKFCGKVMETIVVPATGHGATEWKITKEATACDTGVMSEVCKDCGAALNTKEIAATGKGKHEANDNWTIVRQPNSYQEGKAIKTCKYCGVQMAKKYFTNASSLGNNVKVDTSKKDTTSTSKNNAPAASNNVNVNKTAKVENVAWTLGEAIAFEGTDVTLTITKDAEGKYVFTFNKEVKAAKVAFVAADATEAPAEEAYKNILDTTVVITDADVAANIYVVIEF